MGPLYAGRSVTVSRLSGRARLPPVVGERLVGLSHAEDVVLLFEGATLTGDSVEDLGAQPFGHDLLAAFASEGHQPADGERAGTTSGDFDGHLIGGAADPATAHLEVRRERLDGFLQHLDRIAAGARAYDLEGIVNDAFGDGLLAVEQDLVDDLRDELVVVDGVGQDLSKGDGTAAWHNSSLSLRLCAVFGARLLAIGHPGRVECAANDLVAHARQVLDAAAADEHHGVLLKIVPDARDVGGDLDAVGQPDARDLAQSGVGLLGRVRVDTRADAPLLRRCLEGGRLGPLDLALAAFAHELVDRGHATFLSVVRRCPQVRTAVA